ncbi:MAG: aspartate ammonia-lyase [Spirochaetaceae bacterium]|jgi:aspartate ammonia-lyase|nr:aspartate ammonia-lyase [Spirochaetaceae bacterium]
MDGSFTEKDTANANGYRTEKDFLGELKLPAGALYGIETQRARNNFALSYKTVNPRLIRAIIVIKKAAALAMIKTGGAAKDTMGGSESGGTEGGGESAKFHAIAEACDKLLSIGEKNGSDENGNEAAYNELFIVDALQGGAGTSTNMNVNEVIANTALKILGKKPGDYKIVDPIDDVNRFQSTNDVYPTALRIAAIQQLRSLSNSCAELQESLQIRENDFASIKKLGRTELMDAMPVSLGGEFGAWAQAIARDRWRLYKMEERLRQINTGGQAVGISGKEQRIFRFTMIEELRRLTGIGLAAAEYPMDITQNNDVFVEASGLLKALAVNIMKISNDLRLMNSGPRGGFGEIRLAPLQTGSTIMPGKVNPVICEMAIQAAIKVMANDQAVTMAASHGEFELNPFLPLIADSLLGSLSLLERTSRILRTHCIELLTADESACAAHLENSLAFAYARINELGYRSLGQIIKNGGGDIEKIKADIENAVKTQKHGGNHE